MSAPPDLGAHSISWCIAPARDYATTLSGAEEEMFRETDVPVRLARLSLLFAKRVTALIGELPFRRDERPRPWPLLTGPSWELHMLQGQRSYLHWLNGNQMVLMLS